MRRRIDFHNEHYNVTVFNQNGEQLLQVEDSVPHLVSLTSNGSLNHEIKMGDKIVNADMKVKGEKAYIRAFGQTFTLSIINPVEQAAQESGNKINTARAPMPGIVVDVQVTSGTQVTKRDPMMTIESMKILTIITAPMDGEVLQVNFKPGDSFDKNAELVVLSEEGDVKCVV